MPLWHRMRLMSVWRMVCWGLLVVRGNVVRMTRGGVDGSGGGVYINRRRLVQSCARRRESGGRRLFPRYKNYVLVKITQKKHTQIFTNYHVSPFGIVHIFLVKKSSLRELGIWEIVLWFKTQEKEEVKMKIIITVILFLFKLNCKGFVDIISTTGKKTTNTYFNNYIK